MKCIAVLLLLINCTSAGRYGSSGGSRHSYPHSTGYSGNTYKTHSYPSSHGLSGNTQRSNTYYNHKTEVHHHYHYNPPQHITYGSTSHPVYHGTPPVYIYEYRNSGSRFDSLLTGLALYNLGRMSASHHHYDSRDYRGNPGEICKLGISKSNGEYEETRIDCKLMSSFIWEAEIESNKVTSNTISKKTTVVTNKTTSGNESVVTSVETTQVVDALQVKGPSIPVTSGMNCFMIRISRDSSILKKKVECGLLQAYARNSLYSKSNCVSIHHLTFILTMIILVIGNN